VGQRAVGSVFARVDPGCHQAQSPSASLRCFGCVVAHRGAATRRRSPGY
jgi:hypothetical protein